MKKQLPDPERIVKCACGLVLRQKNWVYHWRTCYKGSAVPVTQQDINNLLEHEKQDFPR